MDEPRRYYAERKKPDTNTMWFHLYEAVGQAKVIHGARDHNSSCCLGQVYVFVEGGLFSEEWKAETFWVKEMFAIFTWVVYAHVYTCTKKSLSVYLRWVPFLYVNYLNPIL